MRTDQKKLIKDILNQREYHPAFGIKLSINYLNAKSILNKLFDKLIIKKPEFEIVLDIYFIDTEKLKIDLYTVQGNYLRGDLVIEEVININENQFIQKDIDQYLIDIRKMDSFRSFFNNYSLAPTTEQLQAGAMEEANSLMYKALDQSSIQKVNIDNIYSSDFNSYKEYGY